MDNEMQKLQEKLKLYLSSLSEKAQKLLLREVEKTCRDGSGDAASDLILSTLREIMKIEGTVDLLEGHAKAEFFKEALIFVSPIELSRKSEGCISPGSIDKVWDWIKSEVATPRQQEALQTNCTEMNEQEINNSALALRGDLVASINKHLKDASRQFGGEQKLTNQLGGEVAYKDLFDILVSKERFVPLLPLWSKLDQEIVSWTDADGKSAYQAIEQFLHNSPTKSAWLFSAISKRFPNPRLRIELAAKLAGSDDAHQIAKTIYASSVHQVVAEMESLIPLIDASVYEAADIDECMQYFETWHKYAKAMDVELQLSSNDAWNKKLNQSKKMLCSLFERDVESVPSLVRRALKAPKSGEGEVVDEHLIEDAKRAAKIFSHLERAKESLGMNAVATTARKELDQSFEVLTTSLVDRTRLANDKDAKTLALLHEAAIEIAESLFEKDYATSLARQLNAATSAQTMQAIPA